MTKFKLVKFDNLQINKKYLVIERMGEYKFGYASNSYEDNDSNSESDSESDNDKPLFINTFHGKIRKIDYYKDIILFDKLYNTISGCISRIDNFHKNDVSIYEFINVKNNIQLCMEERSLKDIMQNIIGDKTFNHYLFHKENEVNQIKLNFEEIDTYEEQSSIQIDELEKI